MAKTKRRSCKGGRRSRRCRGGVLPSYKTPYRAGPKAHGFGEHPKGVSRLGYDTKIENPRQPSHADLVNQIQRDAFIHFNIVRPSRKFARGLRDSVGSLAGRTASAARGLGASALRSIGLNSHHLDHSKLVTVPEDIHENFGLRENSAKRLYRLDRSSGKLYETSSQHLGPVGHMRDQTDEKTAMFLPGHGPKEGETWAIVNRM